MKGNFKMNAIVRLYSLKKGEISHFLEHFYQDTPPIKDKKYFTNDDLLWQKEYCNPIEIADIIGALIENQEDYNINMWISLDKNLFINITPNNADEVIRYLYERYPY